ncbi:hypothetical protein BT96DRAFT_1027287 [Gymnopus androsaceus JB14]|uniref:Uncharacterized protein n=1 Tax=Gymnopus androsaceus JB14 TaxID=1447944 RepID=A0A6A4GCP2_9AGAR|nr:hypothetical protein BT96DRAFT_1027287 [Gymnopus androsaceus JB14]
MNFCYHLGILFDNEYRLKQQILLLNCLTMTRVLVLRMKMMTIMSADTADNAFINDKEEDEESGTDEEPLPVTQGALEALTKKARTETQVLVTASSDPAAGPTEKEQEHQAQVKQGKEAARNKSPSPNLNEKEETIPKNVTDKAIDRIILRDL